MPPATPRVLRACALLSCACVLAASCTPRQSQDQYETRLERAVQVREDVATRLSARQLTSADEYETAAAQVSAALEELEADPPPRNLVQGHDRMVLGMEGLAILLGRLGRCEALVRASEQDRRACRQSIGQDVYDTIRNDFTEANTIYRQEGLSLTGLGGGTGSGEDSLGEEIEGGDAL
jgi:hypothetical protein